MPASQAHALAAIDLAEVVFRDRPKRPETIDRAIVDNDLLAAKLFDQQDKLDELDRRNQLVLEKVGAVLDRCHVRIDLA